MNDRENPILARGWRHSLPAKRSPLGADTVSETLLLAPRNHAREEVAPKAQTPLRVDAHSAEGTHKRHIQKWRSATNPLTAATSGVV